MTTPLSNGLDNARAQRQVRQGYWRLVGRQFRKRRMAVGSLAVLGLLGLTALTAPLLANDLPLYAVVQGKPYLLPALFEPEGLANLDFTDWQPGQGEWAIMPPVPHSPTATAPFDRVQPPCAEHRLGTDELGRDVLARLIWGARVSMMVGFVSVGIALIIGVPLGAVAGYYGGMVDAVVLRIIEIFLTFPSFFLILAAIALLPPSIYNIMAVIGLLGWMGIARLVRGEFLRLRESDFTIAARATGLSDVRIIFRHVLPNGMAPVWVSATFGVAGAILTESALSFLGFGAPPPTPTWGELLSQSQYYLHRGAWWLVVFPGFAIFLTVTAFNLVGEGLRDAMDPRLRQ
jgi:peptide/nickel transport system permease protein